MQVASWSTALALAPLVMGIAACSGGNEPQDAGFTGGRDAALPHDAGFLTDAGFPDSGVAVRDAGEVRDGGEALDAGEVRDAGEARDAGQPGCTYPAGAVEPMAFGEVLSPYSWANAREFGGRQLDLSLTDAFCNTDLDMDWSPYDVLLFVSIPAF